MFSAFHEPSLTICFAALAIGTGLGADARARPPQAGPTAPPAAPRSPTPARQPPAAPASPPVEAESSETQARGDASTPAGLALALSEMLRDAIPRRYEKKQDWERTRHITTGIRTEGSGLDIRFKRHKSEVNHGTWKHYRIQMVEPDTHLDVRVENLRSLEPGRIAFTVYFDTKLEGWAQARVYNRGIHFITLTAEGNTSMRLWLDCEVALSLAPATLLTGVAVNPVVTDARLELDDFELSRISKIDGPLVQELGKGLRYVILEELDSPSLVARLNRAIEKKRDRLTFSPGDKWQLPRAAPAEQVDEQLPAEAE